MPHPRTGPQERRTRHQARQRDAGAPRRPRRRIFRWFFFLCFLVVDILALVKLALNTDWITVGLGFSVISFITTAVYKDDKGGAQIGAWRTSETLLHLLEIAGGWPAAFLAQQRYRHKTVKFSYQFFFWSIGLLHLILASCYLLGLPLIRSLLTQA